MLGYPMYGHKYRLAALATIAALAAFSHVALAEDLAVRHLYTLSDFSGAVPYNGGRLVADPPTGEIYVVASNEVRVFNDAGMQVYRFGHPADELLGEGESR